MSCVPPTNGQLVEITTPSVFVTKLVLVVDRFFPKYASFLSFFPVGRSIPTCETVQYDGLPGNDTDKLFSGLDALDLLGYPRGGRQEFLQNSGCKLGISGLV